MVSNIWVDKEFKDIFEKIFQKRKMDIIPAECNGKEGFLVISMTLPEVQKVLSAITRGVVVDVVGEKMAKIKGTSISINVNTIEKL